MPLESPLTSQQLQSSLGVQLADDNDDNNDDFYNNTANTDANTDTKNVNNISSIRAAAQSTTHEPSTIIAIDNALVAQAQPVKLEKSVVASNVVVVKQETTTTTTTTTTTVAADERLAAAFDVLLATRIDEPLPDALLRHIAADLDVVESRATMAAQHGATLRNVLAALAAIVDSAPSAAWSHASFGGATARGPSTLGATRQALEAALVALRIAALPDATRALAIDDALDGSLRLTRAVVVAGLAPLFDASLEALARTNKRMGLAAEHDEHEQHDDADAVAAVAAKRGRCDDASSDMPPPPARAARAPQKRANASVDVDNNSGGGGGGGGGGGDDATARQSHVQLARAGVQLVNTLLGLVG